MSLPAYHPDATKVELLEQRALDNDIWLGCQDIYTLEYIGICEELRPQGLTMGEIGWALNDQEQWLYPRLLGLEGYGLVKKETTWEKKRAFDGSETDEPVSYWRLTSAGWSVLVIVCEIAPPGPRSRPSALAE